MEYSADQFGDPAIDQALQNAAAQQMPPEAAVGLMAVMGGFFVFFVILGIAVYVYYALCLMKIAQKTKTDNAWFAWIPILNFILMIKVAKRPLWWALSLLLAFIPFANLLLIVVMVIIWMDIAKAVNKPNWWGILIIVPIANLVVPGYLAFSKDDGVKPVSV